MRTTAVENAALSLAALGLGLMAGFFATYTINVNLALAQVDGSTYATVQSLLNQTVRHPAFGVLFFGGVAAPAAALALNWRHAASAPFWLLATGAAIYLVGVVVFTANVHLPLNMYIESWDPPALPSDWAATRAAWNQANAVRAGSAALAFLLTLAALTFRALPASVGSEPPPPDASPFPAADHPAGCASARSR